MKAKSSYELRSPNNIFLVIEGIVVASVLGFIGWWIYDHAGGPLLLDELTYMSVAIIRAKEVALINRYFPVYLLMPFIRLVGDPFIAVKVFWTLLVMLTALFLYLSARILSKAHIPAIAALALYFAQVGIFHYPGVVWPDFTVMLLFSMVIFLYLLLPSSRRWQPLVLGLIGALLYFAVRSKETASVLVFLFLGYGFVDGKDFHWRELARKLLWSFIGFIAGMVFIFLLDWVVLGDVLWTVRGILETMRLSWIEYVERVDFNYLLLLTDGLDTFTMLVLYVISGLMLYKYQSNYHRVLFILPLVYLLTMTAAILRGPGVIEARYLVPIIPLMCILATLMLRNETTVSAHGKIIALVTVLGGFLLICQFPVWMIRFLRYFGIDKWDVNNLYMSVLYPAAFIIFLFIWFGVKKSNMTTLTMSLLCFAAMLYHPLEYNHRYLVTRWAAGQSEYRFYPFRVFEEDLAYSENMRVFLSEDLPRGNPMNRESGMLALREDVVATMYIVYFQHEVRADQFVIGNIDEYHAKADLYSHAIITSSDWSAVSAEMQGALTQNNMILHDDVEELVLLRRMD